MSDSTGAGPGPKVAAAIQQLREQRDQTIAELGSLTDDVMRVPAVWAGTARTVNFLFRAFSLHELDHYQHMIRLLRGRNVDPSQAQLLLMKAQALRGEMEGLLLSLSDEEFTAAGPDGDWSMEQLVQHLRETDRNYHNNIRKGLEEAQQKAGA